MFRRVNIGRSVERDIIWNSHGAQILSAVFKIRRSIFPLDKALNDPTTIIFSFRTYIHVDKIFDDDYSFYYTIRDVFSFVLFLFSFFILFFLFS